MRSGFGNTERLKRTARFNVGKGRHHLKGWWIQKYNRPPTDSLFTLQSEAELMLEMYEDLYAKRDELEARLESGDADNQQQCMRRIVDINKVLGEGVVAEDDVIDEWEADIAAGRMPDLDK